MIKYIVEFIGTFIFLSVIIISGEAIPIGIALAAMILFGGKISGGNFNPAVSTMMLLNNTLDMSQYLGYIIAQILGAICAYYFYSTNKSYFNKT
jgi:aquaporin Z